MVEDGRRDARHVSERVVRDMKPEMGVRGEVQSQHGVTV